MLEAFAGLRARVQRPEGCSAERIARPAQVGGQAMAAALLRRRDGGGAFSSALDGETVDIPKTLDGRTLELAAIWVDPALEDRLEVACCVLYFLGQYLLACDGVCALYEGARSIVIWRSLAAAAVWPAVWPPRMRRRGVVASWYTSGRTGTVQSPDAVLGFAASANSVGCACRGRTQAVGTHQHWDTAHVDCFSELLV